MPAADKIKEKITEASFSSEARKRLRKPLCRGSFRPLDAARRQLGLLTAADNKGQARFYCLVNLESKIIEDARFLAFGDLSSHPIADAYAELMRMRSLEDGLCISSSEIETFLRAGVNTDTAAEHAFAGDDSVFEFIAEAQKNLALAFPSVKLLAKPVEKDVYKRKRDADWTDEDRSWFPLGLLKKIAALQKSIGTLLSDKVSNKPQHNDLQWSIEGLHDDFKVVIKISGIAEEEKPTLLRFMEEAVHQDIHPGLSVEEYTS